MKKAISIILIFALCISYLTVRALDTAETIICSPDLSENLSFLNKDDFEVYNMYGSNCYFVPEDSVLNFNINDNIFYNNTDYKNIEIDIKYLDSQGAYFYLTYDSLDSAKKTYNDYIEQYNTREIKTAKIRLEDAKFANRVENADFTLTSPDTNYGKGVYIYSVEVKVLDSFSGVNISAQSMSAGNIFFDGDERKINITYENSYEKSFDMNVAYTIEDIDSNVLYDSEEKKITLNSLSSVTDSYYIKNISKYGTYKLYVTAKCEKYNIEVLKEISFSICTRSVVNENLGISGHFNWGRECANGISILKNAGFGMIREGYSWPSFEKKKGVYTEPSACSEYLSNAEKNGMQTLVMAGFNNTLYGCTNVKEIPNTDEQRAAYVNYIREMLKKNPTKIKYLEIWNEPDINAFNYNSEEPYVYAELLKAVYEGIKPEFPDVIIVAPALAASIVESGRTWLENFLNTDFDGDGIYDTYKYFDAASFHHYSKNMQSVVIELGKINDLLKQYGAGEKEIYYTEFGTNNIIGSYTSTGTGTINLRGEKNQAAMLARYYLTLQSAGIADKFFIYDFSNDGFIENYSENTYGIVNNEKSDVPYSAKDSLIAMANLNNLLSDFDNCDYNLYGNTSVVTFDCTEKKRKTISVYTDADISDTYKFINDGEYAEFYDMYGNRLTLEETDGYYSIPVTNYPIYIKVYYSLAENVNVFNGENGVVKIRGTLYNSNSGDMLGVQILDKNGNIKYIDQLTLDKNLQFEFSFKPSENEERYYMYLGSKSFNNIYELEFNKNDLYKASLNLYSDMLEINDMNSLTLVSDVKIKTELGDSTVSEFNVVVAYYSKDTMTNIKVVDSNDMIKNDDVYTLNTDIKLNENADCVKLYMFDSLNGLYPLSKNVILK